MSVYVQNYGFTKTYLKENDKQRENEIKWIGNYDGKDVNLQLDINDNGNNQVMNIQLDNNDIMRLLSEQPIETPLPTRLINDFSMKEPNVVFTEFSIPTKRNKKSRKNKNRSNLLKKKGRKSRHRPRH